MYYNIIWHGLTDTLLTLGVVRPAGPQRLAELMMTVEEGVGVGRT